MGAANRYKDQIFISQDGVYFALDGSVAYTADPARGGGDSYARGDFPAVIQDIYDAPEHKEERELARDRLDSVIKNDPAAQYMLEGGTKVVLNLGENVQLLQGGGFRDSTYLPYDPAQSPAGSALPYLDAIYLNTGRIYDAQTGNAQIDRLAADLNRFGDAHFRDAFREEMTHLLDERMARLAGQHPGAARHYSHMTSPSDVQSVAQLDSGALHAVLRSEGLHRKGSNAQTEDLPIGVFIEEEMRGILQLDGAVYNNIRGETRDLAPQNSSVDTEIMSKFHVLRMRLEDVAGDKNYFEMDPSKSRVLEALSAYAPDLARAYREEWLPAVHITTSLRNEDMQSLVLGAYSPDWQRAHGAENVQRTGDITPQEFEALSEAGVRFRGLGDNNPDNDSMRIGNQNLPIQIIDEGRER